jgi:hypothetical protein
VTAPPPPQIYLPTSDPMPSANDSDAATDAT